MTPQVKKIEIDDGSVICDMNVEGMPGYVPGLGVGGQRLASSTSPGGEVFSRSGMRRYTFYAVLAGLSIALTISAAWVILLLFLTRVLFR